MDLSIHCVNILFLFERGLKPMKLKDNVEAVIQLLNSPHVGPYLEFENGDVLMKNNIEHFVIIHTNAPYEWEDRANVSKPKTRRKKKVAEVSEEENMANLAAYEEVDETEIGRNEEKITISSDEELQLIRKLRKINCGSLSTLADNGWFICPVYANMSSLNPVYVKQLPKHKGYKLMISDTEILNLPKGSFSQETIKQWELNSMFEFDRIFSRMIGYRAMSVFIHKKESFATKMMKNAVNRLETTQRTRIKLGNILVDEVLTFVGQEAYASNKENLAQKVKDDAGDNTEVTEHDTKTFQSFIKYLKISQLAQS